MSTPKTDGSTIYHSTNAGKPQKGITTARPPEVLFPGMSSGSSKNEQQAIEENQMINDRWRIRKLIGGGGFGRIFLVYDIREGRDLAMKVAYRINKTDGAVQATRMTCEVRIMQQYADASQHGVKVYGVGKVKDAYDFVVMDLLSKNLSDLRRLSPQRRFTRATSTRLIAQMVEAVGDIHRLQYLHRDIKPSNMAMGIEEKVLHVCFLIDFGLVRRYKEANGTRRPRRDRAGFRGTNRYASVNVHQRLEQSPVDDMWSLVYSLIELATGQLPWRAYTDIGKILESKKRANYDELCSTFPHPVRQFVADIQSMKYEDEPNYQTLQKYLEDGTKALGITEDDPFDWEDGKWDSLKKEKVNHYKHQLNQQNQLLSTCSRKPPSIDK